MTDFVDDVWESFSKLTLILMKKGIITYEESSDIQNPYKKLNELVNEAINERNQNKSTSSTSQK